MFIFVILLTLFVVWFPFFDVFFLNQVFATNIPYDFYSWALITTMLLIGTTGRLFLRSIAPILN